MTNKVSVIIPNYNGEDLLVKNPPSVINASKNRNNKIVEIIIVDDASTDKSVELIKRDYPEIRLIKHKVNRGFSSAVNTGVRSAKGNLVCLLNTDVVVEDDFLVSVFPHFKKLKVFGVSLHEKDYGWRKGAFKDGYIVHTPGGRSKNAESTFWVSGGSGVFRRDYWIKLRGFDEKLYKFYWEDIDLCYRAAKRGYALLWEPNARVVHKHESTTSTRFSKRKLQTMQEVNHLIFIWKNLTSANLFRKHLTGLVKRVLRHPGYIKIVFLALFKIRVILRARKKEKKESKVSDEAVFARFS